MAECRGCRTTSGAGLVQISYSGMHGRVGAPLSMGNDFLSDQGNGVQAASLVAAAISWGSIHIYSKKLA